MVSPALSFEHRFEPASRPGSVPLLLLHGTGGDENDLIPLGGMLSPGAALLSPRGLSNAAFGSSSRPSAMRSRSFPPVPCNSNNVRFEVPGTNS